MNKLYDEESIQDIADAIRAKNGSSDTYLVSEMAEAVLDIPADGPTIVNYTVQQVTQSQYDALQSYDPLTFYVVPRA